MWGRWYSVRNNVNRLDSIAPCIPKVVSKSMRLLTLHPALIRVLLLEARRSSASATLCRSNLKAFINSVPKSYLYILSEEARGFPLLWNVRNICVFATQPPTKGLTKSPFPGMKRSGYEVDRSVSFNVEFKDDFSLSVRWRSSYCGPFRSFYLTENTLCANNKDQLVNAVYWKGLCYF